MTSEHDGEQLIAGRYELRSLIGRGGSGAVWHAYDTTLERPVAVKEVRFPPSVPAGERDTMRARFVREGRTAARLNHPNAITVYDTHEEDGRAFLVMELFECPTLDALVRARGLYTPEAAAELGLEILAALEAAHARGIVHRDVKPSNVLVGDSVKLTDFGIAYLLDDPSVTTTGSIVGSPSYMAPEQARDNSSSSASDLYCLGATLYYAVEGKAPFARGSAIATLTAVLNEAPPAPRHAGRLEPLILDLLAKNPDARPSSREARSRLEDVALASGGSEAAGAAGVPPTQVLDEPPAPQPAPQRTPPPAPSRPTARRHVPAALLIVLLLIAGAVVAALLRDSPADEVAGEAGGQAPTDAAEEPQNDDAGTAASGNPGDGEDGPAAEADGATAAEPEADAAPSGEVPEGWTVYTNPDLGYEVAHPDGWSVETSGGQMVDIRDPGSPTYLRIDYTDTPPDDPVADWQRQSESFGSRQDGYEEIRIEPASFQGQDAALWEYRYSAGGATLRAYNLGVHYGDFGQALNFQTSEDRWDDEQELWETFQRTFRPAGGT